MLFAGTKIAAFFCRYRKEGRARLLEATVKKSIAIGNRPAGWHVSKGRPQLTKKTLSSHFNFGHSAMLAG
jgi:hypothetical protein